jgi:hypothetical protein
MTISRHLLPCLVLAGAFALASSAEAGGILVGNLDQPPVTDPGQLVFVNSTNFLAQQFTTANDPVQVTSIIASLGEMDTGSGGFSLLAELVADHNNSPTGSVLTTFTLNAGTPIPTTGNGYANVEFDPNSTVNLAANTPYWFVLEGQSSDGTGLVYWQYTLSTTTHGPGTLPFGGVFYTDPPGQSWQVFPNEPSLIQVNVVPEPASVVLGGLSAGLLLAASIRTRTHRRRA